MRPRSSPRASLSRLAVTFVIIFLIYETWSRTSSWNRYVCDGSGQPLHDISQVPTQDLPGNPHEPLLIESPSINNLNFGDLASPKEKDRVLILTPLRDAAPYLPKYFEVLSQLTYPHNYIDLAFLVGDCVDETLSTLREQLEKLQNESNVARFRSAMIVEKNFGFELAQSVKERHSFQAQGPRRKAIGRARNYLLYAAMRPVHDWIYWRDVDVVENPATVLEDFIKHDKDVLVPNIWFHRLDKLGKDIEGRYDYNSWQESWWGRRLKKRISKDTILAEGYKEYKTRRKYLNWMGNRRKNKDKEVPLDGIGGVNIVVKAEVHRSGINFPCYPFENQADTEGFAAMAKRAGYSVFGLPNYVVWHVDTEEKEGNLKGNKVKEQKDS
ncbi:uncharacterized protein KY384_001853 [Bacidia gigantensis]|uniref:uncharacterized protein n=1 Tax=Bacidia gigantensis TaxID=2732470 RepID=UPI001D047210|nr:uncharacterized protein KY384_001853 [Bacidia gigantensis]KAG8533070.1 hypothetical protein KY384_001853 [Bacidia gigantensis]